MKLSAALIVKNEEAFLSRCLESIKNEVDEIIIVDTGSTDNTVEIAKKFTDKVYYYKWHDDFAAARNEAFKYATGDYILSIDADEYLVSKDIKSKIKGEGDGVSVKLLWEENHECFHRAPRIFKKGLKWVGECHETIACATSIKSDIEIVYGNSPTHKEDPNRNIRILESVKDKKARDYFYLSREYFMLGEYEKSLKYTDECIEKSTWRYEKADAYLTGARCLFYLQQGDKARQYCLNAIMLNPEFQEALCFMGDLSWEKEKQTWIKYAKIANNKDVIFLRSNPLLSVSYPQNHEPILKIIQDINPKSILDMGIGTGQYGETIKGAMPNVLLDGVEIFPKYKNPLWEYYNEVFIGDIREIKLGEYDMYLIIDVIEHMTIEDGLELLKKLKGNILISTPRDYDQDEVHGNPFQKHLSKWTVEDFKEFDFDDYSNELSIIIYIKNSK
jgi:glycosyltransferase involved in cell wall biosynthesis